MRRRRVLKPRFPLVRSVCHVAPERQSRDARLVQRTSILRNLPCPPPSRAWCSNPPSGPDDLAQRGKARITELQFADSRQLDGRSARHLTVGSPALLSPPHFVSTLGAGPLGRRSCARVTGMVAVTDRILARSSAESSCAVPALPPTQYLRTVDGLLARSGAAYLVLRVFLGGVHRPARRLAPLLHLPGHGAFHVMSMASPGDIVALGQFLLFPAMASPPSSRALVRPPSRRALARPFQDRGCVPFAHDDGVRRPA